MTLTAKEYAARINMSGAWVTQQLKAQLKAGKDLKLPGATRIEKWGNAWMITLRENVNLVDAMEKFNSKKYL